MFAPKNCPNPFKLWIPKDKHNQIERKKKIETFTRKIVHSPREMQAVRSSAEILAEIQYGLISIKLDTR